MTTLRLLRTGFVLVLLLGLSSFRLAPSLGAPGPDPEDLKRGLLVTYHDGARSLTSVEPTVALALKATEAPHPSLAPTAGKYHWRGYLNLLRGGKYRFAAWLRGNVVVRVGETVVLKSEVNAAEAVLQDGAEVELPAGVSGFDVAYERPAGMARLELLWQGPGFRREPLPQDFVGHLDAKDLLSLTHQAQEELGRDLVEEHSCVKCHAPEGNKVGATLGARAGPDLSKIGGRVHIGWIDRWLEAPHALQPGAVMPVLFGADEAGKAERHAVARYLGALGTKMPASGVVAPKDAATRLSKGEKLYHSVGCVVCHGPYPANGPVKTEAGPYYGAPTVYPLTGLGSKTTPEKLAEYLANPLTINPSGRMPHMLLVGDEARDIAWFLTRSVVPGLTPGLPPTPALSALEAAFKLVDPREDELAAWKKLDAEKQLLELGKRSVIARGCNNCHKIEPDGQPFASVLSEDLATLALPAKREQGCLAAAPGNKAPRFVLTPEQRQAIRQFLDTGLKGAGSPAPAYHARVAVRRFNCLACHQKDGEGGLTTALTETLRKYEKVENSEALSPPGLNGVGHKLRTTTLRGVLLQASRVRSYMGLRMPQFGEANVGGLVEGLATLEGTVPDDAIHKVDLSSAKLAAGRDLAGKGAFGCASCHDMAGVPNFGTRGPDLALTPSRIRYDWYLRWLEQPQRMQVGTKMPAVFTGGKSLVDRIFDGHADRQAEAMWAYFSLGSNMPLPEGMEPPKGLIVAVKDTPVTLRTFMPEAGSRAIAVGYPGGVSVAFDANAGRLAYAWSGTFLDAAPVWANRGGAPAKILGTKFWTAPAGNPVGITEGDDPPDFALRAKDFAYGAAVPENQIYQGQRHVRFDGYTLGAKGDPTFRYQVDGAGATARVHETIVGQRAAAGIGLHRAFTLEVPVGRTGWLLLAESPVEPQLLALEGIAKKLDLASGKSVFSIKDGALLFPLDAERVQVVQVAGADAKFRVQKLGNAWQVLTQIAGDGKPQPLAVRIWQPYRNDPVLLRELLASK